MVGVFGAKMAMSFRSSGVGLKAEIFGQFGDLGLHCSRGLVCGLCPWAVD